MAFHPIDIQHWQRKPYYEHYMNTVRCTYSVTVNIDVDGLLETIRSLGLKHYPVQVYMIARVVNAFPEFRMALDGEGAPGCWDVTHPSYTVFNKKAESFSSIYTPYDSGFAVFYRQCSSDIAAYSSAKTLFPQTDVPENVFTISSLPWLDFTAFNLNVHGEGTYLPPVFTIGKYVEVNGIKHMPLAVQVHHAVCDGWHVGRFVEALRDLATEHEGWIA